MLALTESATEAIEGILEAPSIPDGAGLRIAPGESSDGTSADAGDLSLTLAATPAESDEVIEEGDARVFVDQPLTGFLDEKVLDAETSGDRVAFTLGEQID